VALFGVPNFLQYFKQYNLLGTAQDGMLGANVNPAPIMMIATLEDDLLLTFQSHDRHDLKVAIGFWVWV